MCFARHSCRERNDGLYRPVTYVIFKMLEELSITLVNSLVFSAMVFYPLHLSGDFILFWAHLPHHHVDRHWCAKKELL